MDFVTISKKIKANGTVEIYPKFIINESKDLMVKDGDFYAAWDDINKCWTTSEYRTINLIDNMLDNYVLEHKKELPNNVNIKYLWDAESGSIDLWHKFVQRQKRDEYTYLDSKLTFKSDITEKEHYSSKRLKYDIVEQPFDGFETIISTLYSPEERFKIEWTIGCILSGDSRHIHKFSVLYGAVGTGKSTIISIIEKLFDGYCSVFNAKTLGSNDSFAMEAFRDNPLVSIQHDGDLSRIEDNTKLNSLVSHENMAVNIKHKSLYTSAFSTYLIIGTNKPVKITDAKSGIIRRLIDISPSGNKLPFDIYKKSVNKIPFELGGIAYHCLNVYNENKNAFDDYIPVNMMGATNDMYNFILDSYDTLRNLNNITLKQAWEMYKKYAEDTNITYAYSQRVFKEELKNYYLNFNERIHIESVGRLRNYYSGFNIDKYENSIKNKEKTIEDISSGWIKLDDKNCKFSFLDKVGKAENFKAQLANKDGFPLHKWSEVNTTLNDIDTSMLHWVQLQENHIVLDFDIRDEYGNKSLIKNIERASDFPKTYVETSKSGGGLHLHYYYNGDVNQLKNLIEDGIEIKVQKGASSLRRKLISCNDLDIATISTGLPLKDMNGRNDKQMFNKVNFVDEVKLRSTISRALKKDIMVSTKSNMDFIKHILDEAYKSNKSYDVSDLYNDILAFAMSSTNNSKYCIKLMNEIKFKSEEHADIVDYSTNDFETLLHDYSSFVFFDIEIFKSLSLVCYKRYGSGTVHALINPKPNEIEMLMKEKLIGFNNRGYDNHILYAMLLGYNNMQLYDLSKRIISDENSKNSKFLEAYNISYADFYDYATVKQSLKKYQLSLGIIHMELGIPWEIDDLNDKQIEKVVKYCKNDVISLEEVFNKYIGDYKARLILADISGGTVNNTTNALTTKLIFGNNKKPQSEFNYRDMGDTSKITKTYFNDEFTAFDDNDMPIFPGYKFEYGKSTYRGYEVSEGGQIFVEEGAYGITRLFDVDSMHPSSTIAENIFGDIYTKRYQELVACRLCIKRGDIETAKGLLNGKLVKYLDNPEYYKPIQLALKLAINQVYGQTMTPYENPFRDVRNKDNIIAKRGALFMINLKSILEKHGVKVIHIKTDSIKIDNTTDEIHKLINEYGALYKYSFTFEAEYDRFCIVNKADYVARYSNNELNGDNIGKWTSTGAVFSQPYCFKKMFSKEAIEFDDLTVLKSTRAGDIYLDFNENLGDTTELSKRLNKLKKLDKTDELNAEILELENEIQKHHKYEFVGRVGQFTPVKPGHNGGNLYSKIEKVDNKTGLMTVKYDSVLGTKGHRWLESQLVNNINNENNIDIIDYDYFDNMIKDRNELLLKYVINVNEFTNECSYESYLNNLMPF